MQGVNAPQPRTARPVSAPVAVIGAMAAEVARLRLQLADQETLHEAPFLVQRGRLAGVAVLLAECGIGKVNAAALTQLLVSAGAGACLFTGVAGAVARDVRVGDVVIASDTVQHDVDVTALGYVPGEVPGVGERWPADERLVSLCQAAAREAVAFESASDAGAAATPGIATPRIATPRIATPRIATGTIASGDQFVSSPARAADIHERFGALCTEMEGAACAQVCTAWGVPFAVVRSISDTADHEAEVDFRAFTDLAARRAERIVVGVLSRLAAADV